jgi:AcrR family transcriptional regulator
MQATQVIQLLERWKALDEKASNRMIAVGRAGARLFGETGYLNVTMEGIAAEGGMSKGGIYHYFESKAEILFFIVNKTIDDLLMGLPEELYSIDSGRDRVGSLMRRQLSYYYGHLDEVKTLLSDRKLLPLEFRRLVDLKEERYFHLVEREIALLAPHLDEGRLTTVTFAFFGLCNWIPSWYRPEGRLEIDEIFQVNFTLFMDGVRNIRGDVADLASLQIPFAGTSK